MILQKTEPLMSNAPANFRTEAWSCSKCAVNHYAAHGVVYFRLTNSNWCGRCLLLHSSPTASGPAHISAGCNNKYICKWKPTKLLCLGVVLGRGTERVRESESSDAFYCAFVFDAGGREKLNSSCRISAGILLCEKGLFFCLKSTFSQGPLAFSNITKLLIYCVE